MRLWWKRCRIKLNWNKINHSQNRNKLEFNEANKSHSLEFYGLPIFKCEFVQVCNWNYVHKWSDNSHLGLLGFISIQPDTNPLLTHFQSQPPNAYPKGNCRKLVKIWLTNVNCTEGRQKTVFMLSKKLISNQVLHFTETLMKVNSQILVFIFLSTLTLPYLTSNFFLRGVDRVSVWCYPLSTSSSFYFFYTGEHIIYTYLIQCQMFLMLFHEWMRERDDEC